jgi:uncharacterized membrane protein
MIKIVWAASAIYAGVFFLLGVDRYATFHSGADLGIFSQSIANAAHGMENTYEGASHFAFHFSPILYLCAPFLWLAHSAVALIGIQAVATALVAPGLYLIARKRATEKHAAALACIALLYPPLQGVTFTDFHENGFVPAAVVWLLWAIDARRFGVAAILLALVLSIKEDQAPAMAWLGFVGLAYFVAALRQASPERAAEQRSRRAQGDAIEVARLRRGSFFSGAAIVAAVAVFVLYFTVIRPLAGAHGSWIPEHFYAWGGPGAPTIPLSKQILGRVTYLLEVFVPLAFLPFRSRALILAIPGLVEVLASREPLTYTMGQHYAAVWIPYVLVAFVVAGARLFEANARRGALWVRTSAAASILVLIFFSPLHLAHYLRPLQPSDSATNALIAAVPAQASIGTYDEIYAHLGFYPHAAVGLRGSPEYVIYNRHYASAFWDGVVLPQLRREIAEHAYRVVRRENGVLLLRHT